jgi:glyceraldehyde 3-phosphate dehydrogenase
VAKVLHDKWGIKRGLMTTVHATTATQEDGRRPEQQGLARRPRHPREHHPSSTGAPRRSVW